jgi:uncharacterized protein with HEPN domain
MKRDYKLFVKDILDAIDKIEEFIGNMEYGEFIQDDKTSTAVVKKIEIIGEAIKNISRDVRVKYNAIPWKDIVGMKNMSYSEPAEQKELSNYKNGEWVIINGQLV